MNEVEQVTAVLSDLAARHTDAENRLLSLVYDDLRRIARHLRRGGIGAETLATTGLVHEAWLRLLARDAPSFDNRRHFFAVAARAMRNVAIDYARRQLTEKRGGDQVRVPLDIALDQARDGAPESLILGIDEALEQLDHDAPRLARHVSLSFFTGLSHAEIAELEDLDERTVRRDWRKARAWLYDFFSRQEG